MVGFVRDPDTNGPATGAKVSLVYMTTDIIGRKQPSTVREVVGRLDGPLSHLRPSRGHDGQGAGFPQRRQLRRSADRGQPQLALRAFSIVAQQKSIAEVKNDSGKVTQGREGHRRR